MAPARVSRARVVSTQANAAKKGKVKKVVLAYSGGLDTSIILKWLQDEYGCEVVTFTADLGQVSGALWRAGAGQAHGTCSAFRGALGGSVPTAAPATALAKDAATWAAAFRRAGRQGLREWAKERGCKHACARACGAGDQSRGSEPLCLLQGSPTACRSISCVCAAKHTAALLQAAAQAKRAQCGSRNWLLSFRSHIAARTARRHHSAAIHHTKNHLKPLCTMFDQR